jgi:hypothetical protein
MSAWHLADLRNELERRGWRIVAELPGDDYRISGSWEVQRSTRRAPLLIDFEGMEGSGDSCLPMPQSYACTLRTQRHLSLYFAKSRMAWDEELAAFLDGLDVAPEVP